MVTLALIGCGGVFAAKGGAAASDLARVGTKRVSKAVLDTIDRVINIEVKKSCTGRLTRGSQGSWLGEGADTLQRTVVASVSRDGESLTGSGAQLKKLWELVTEVVKRELGLMCGRKPKSSLKVRQH